MANYIRFLNTIFDVDDVKIVQKYYDSEKEQYGIYIKLKTNEEIRTVFGNEASAETCIKFFAKDILNCIMLVTPNYIEDNKDEQN